MSKHTGFLGSSRILLADDHPATLAGLRQVFEADPDFTVVGEARVIERVLSACQTHQPDLLLLDLDMPGEMTPYGLVSQLHQTLPQLKIVILTSFSYGTYLDLVSTGIAGYVMKTTPLTELCERLRLVVAGGVWFDPVVLGKYQHRERTMVTLTEREREVIHHLVDGHHDVQISRLLAISERTVRHHVSRLYEKLGIKSRSDLVLWAVRQQLVEF